MMTEADADSLTAEPSAANNPDPSPIPAVNELPVAAAQAAARLS